jgi:glycine dehydrogenase subunit 1
MAYLSNSEQDIRHMLELIGVGNFEELIKNIPGDIRFNRDFNLPPAVSEYEISRHMRQLAAKNETFASFLGGGVYDHYVPAIIETLISRSEFYTSYTPYQPEVSQGNLQAMYEFQSMICELTQMDVTNASMYECGSALAEAVLLALNHTGNKKVILPKSLNPRYRSIIQTYTENMDVEIAEVNLKNFCTDKKALTELADEQTAAIIIQSPNYFGFIEDMEAVLEIQKNLKAIFIMVYDPISLGLLKTPGEFGVDIAIAEGQCLGNQQNYGGPFVGLFSVNESLLRKMPGRISGVTRDVDGKRGFVLTLQTREQHIRRDKATSNICTNSGLMALAAGIYMAVMGKTGIKNVAELCLQKAHYLAEKISEIPGIEIASASPFFKEFTIKTSGACQRIIEAAKEKGILPGIDLEDSGYPGHLLIAVTEKRVKEDMDLLAATIKQTVSKG